MGDQHKAPLLFFFGFSKMKLNMACSETGLQKCIEVDDDKKLLPFFDKRMAQEVDGDSLGDEFVGYRFRITGGNDKQGFPMMQGVLSPERVRLLLTKGSKCYRQRRTGEKKRKSVRGCIVNHDLSVLNLLIVKRGEAQIPGLTDEEKPIRLGPKAGKTYKKAPKIQRLITSVQLQRKRHRVVLKRQRAAKNKTEQASYAALVQQRAKEAKDRRAELLQKRRSSHGSRHSQ